MADDDPNEDAEDDPSTVNLQPEGEVDWLAEARNERDGSEDDEKDGKT